jgi:group II intron reverse transcriptase/maturase
MHGHGKSDGPIGPRKAANKGEAAEAAEPAERLEERSPAKENPLEPDSHRAQTRARLPNGIERVRQKAAEQPCLRFASLWHHVYDLGNLREAYNSLKRRAAPGVDGQTWQTYGEDLETNLADLSDRLARGAYRARPSRRHRIPKEDGSERLIGIPAIEDKIVQAAMVRVLEAIYETEFRGFSYGFRPNRSQHDALDAVTTAIQRKKVSYVLDADIRGCFDTIDHEWLTQFIEHRIADKRVVRHIRKFLKAGVMEGDERIRSEEGTPQGGSLSPLLANVYLHYVLDLWAESWRKKHARGEMYIVRYADDFVVCFQYHGDAEKFHRALETRMKGFNLQLHPKKTRILEFGRFAAENRAKRGAGRPETFDFLGFTHICGRTRKGRFKVERRTQAKRKRGKLKQIRHELRRRMHRPVGVMGKWLGSVVEGHLRYYGVPGNYRALSSFRHQVWRMWRWMLNRRSDKARVTVAGMQRIAARWLPKPRIHHPYPDERFSRKHPRQEPSAAIPHAGICAGGAG